MTGLVLCTLRRRSRTGLSPVSYELKTVYHRAFDFSTENLVEDIHPKEGQQAVPAVIFDTAFVGQFFYENTVGGHAGKLVFRKRAGLSQGLFAG